MNASDLGYFCDNRQEGAVKRGAFTVEVARLTNF